MIERSIQELKRIQAYNQSIIDALPYDAEEIDGRREWTDQLTTIIAELEDIYA